MNNNFILRAIQTTFVCVICILMSSCGSTTQKESVSASSLDQPSLMTANELTDKEKALYSKAKRFMTNGEFNKATSALKQLSKEKPQNAGIKVNLAITYFKLGELELAKQSAEEAIRIQPELPEANNIAGLTSVESGDIINAEKYYKAAIKHKPDYSNAQYNLALLYDIYYQNLAKAVEHYEKYLALNNNQDQNTKDWVEQLRYSLNRE